MKGDLVILATGRDPHIEFELLPSEAEGRRREKQDDTAHYYLVDPDTRRVRNRGTKKTLTWIVLQQSILDELKS